MLTAGSAVLAVLNLTVMALVARHRPEGWLIGIAAQVLWIPYDAVTRQWGFIAISAVAIPVYVHGWRRFRAGREAP